jgi:hypothetical protein
MEEMTAPHASPLPRLEPAARPRSLLAMGGLSLTAGAVALYNGHVELLKPWKVVLGAILLLFGAAAGFGLWTGFWALIGKAVRKEARWRDHLAIALLADLGLTLFNLASSAAAFSLGLFAAGRYAVLAARAAVSFSALYAHIRCATLLTGRQARLAAALLIGGLAAVLGGLSYVVSKQASRLGLQPAISSNLWPPAFRIAKPMPASDFVARANALKKRVDKDRQKPD